MFSILDGYDKILTYFVVTIILHLNNEPTGVTEWHRLSHVSFVFPWAWASYTKFPYTLVSCHLSPLKVHFWDILLIFRFPNGRTDILIL